MKRFWFGSLLLILGLAACEQKSDTKKTSATSQKTNETAPATSSGNPLTAPTDYLGAVGKAKQSATRTLDLAGLNQAIQLFYAQEDRFPKDLQELATKKYIGAVPPPPTGKKFVYDAATGNLKIVNQ